MSKVALFSFADFGWHDATYDAQRDWSAALAERAGGDRKTAAALRAFADIIDLRRHACTGRRRPSSRAADRGLLAALERR